MECKVEQLPNCCVGFYGKKFKISHLEIVCLLQLLETLVVHLLMKLWLKIMLLQSIQHISRVTKLTWSTSFVDLLKYLSNKYGWKVRKLYFSIFTRILLDLLFTIIKKRNICNHSFIYKSRGSSDCTWSNNNAIQNVTRERSENGS